MTNNVFSQFESPMKMPSKESPRRQRLIEIVGDHVGVGSRCGERRAQRRRRRESAIGENRTGEMMAAPWVGFLYWDTGDRIYGIIVCRRRNTE